MIINHNMASLNTYRQLSNNNVNSSKSLEKLSSGLRINKAGDDAAGLAISEKMRGQIRGLDQASRNAQDATSMLNTAEGNLSETHNILQRMKELATQAASDSNVGVDRGEIQKEINQLSSEINRIGNTTEFNTQKLLNGGGVKADVAVKTLIQGAAKGDMGGAVVAATSTGVAAVDQYTFASGLAAAGDSAEFKFNGMTVKLFRGSDGAGAGTSASYSVDANAKTVTVNISASNAAANVTASELDTVVTQALTNYKNNTSTYELANFTVGGGAGVVSLTASTPASGSVDFLNGAAISTTANLGVGTIASTAGSYVLGATDETAKLTVLKNSSSATAAEWAADVTALNDSHSAVVSFNGVTVDLAASASGAVAAAATDGRTASVTVANGGTAEDQAKALKAAFEAAQSFGGTELKDFAFSVRGNGADAQFVITDKAGNGDSHNSLTIGVTNDTGGTMALGTSGTTTSGVNETRGEYTYELGKAFEAVNSSVTIAGKTFTAVEKDAKASSAQFNAGTDAEKQVIELAAAMNADTSISARFDVIADGDKLKLVEKQNKAAGTDLTDGVIKANTAQAGQFSFSIDTPVQSGGKYTIDGVDIRVTSDASDAGLSNGTAVLYDAVANGQASKLNQAIAANSTLSAKYTSAATSSMITLTQKANHESLTAAASSTNTSSAGAFKATFQIGANMGQSMTIDINDMRSQALQVAGMTAGGAASVEGAAFTATKDVTNGTDDTGVEYALDVSGHEKATAAIKVISNAIETVSAERSKIGAYTNRLDHTITNLGTSSENMTAAESRIRDVDMAKEMMNFQKNNILSQAAQAMLAQANQQPQGVLQLLR